jgi:titin
MISNDKFPYLGSRFKITSDFGFVTLDLSDVYERDQGIYTCKAYNKQGEAFTSTTIYCTGNKKMMSKLSKYNKLFLGKEGLIESTQHPKGEEGLEKIQDLEDSLNRPEGAAGEGDAGHAPVFTSQV